MVNPNEGALAPAEAAHALAAVVVEAGTLALSMRVGVRSWNKTASSPVSEADIALDNFLRERLLALVPGYGWLSEETADDPDRLMRRRVWVVDPIDGTRAYISDRTDWSVSAALVEDGRPIAAALYAPVTDELFVAAKNDGASRNGQRLHAQSASPPRPRIAGNKARVDQMISRGAAVEAVPKIHSLALRITRVATGELDAALATAASYDWDLAAADLLVHEAGAVLTSFDGQTIIYNRSEIRHGELIAAGRRLHGPLLAALKGARKGRNLTANA